jgi:hypothetical protein
MKRLDKWGLIALLAIGLVAVGIRAVVSQQPTTTRLLAPPLNPLDDLFENARPHLEAVLGVKLESAPKFQSVSQAELAQAPDYDLEAFIRWHFPHVQGETLARTRQIARQILARAAVAQYAENEGIIRVAPDSLAKIASWDVNLGRVNSDEFLQLALVCEVVRMHLCQRYDIGKLRGSCHDGAELDAVETIIEGRIQAITEKVAEALGSSKVFPLLAARYLRVPDDAPDPLLKAVSQTALHAKNRACVEGMQFFAALRNGGMTQPEQAVFAHMPRQRSVIAHPVSWMRNVANGRADMVAAMRTLATCVPEIDWQLAEQSWTPEMLAQAASLFGAPPERVEKIGETWFDGRTLVWTNRRYPDQIIALSAVRHETVAGARNHFGFAMEMQRKQDTAAGVTCGLPLRIVESKSVPIHLEDFDEAIQNDKRIGIGEGTLVPVSMLLARKGELVVELNFHGQAPEAGMADRLMRAIRIAAD